ncbi:uncharacterized protein TNCV_3948951 [Trichonephila clavipes]|nr:uncharacterized protein TNCV_3948951 [Trichonephila clavipes]
MASSAKKQKVQDSKCSREFQTWWTEKYGIISKGVTKRCVFYVLEQCENGHSRVPNYSAANAIARQGKPFQEGEFSKLWDDFGYKDKIIQRIKVVSPKGTAKPKVREGENDFNDDHREEITHLVQSIPRFQECVEEDVETWRACDAENCGFQMLNDDEIVTSMQEEYDPVYDETDEDEDNNESSKGP